jgi:hypothetical protein
MVISVGLPDRWLVILNSVGIIGLNHMTVLQFAFPESILQGPHQFALTQGYPYRVNLFYETRTDYLSDIAALPRFDLIVGKDDSFFFDDAYKPLFQSVTAKGRYNILAGHGHIDLPYAPET